MSIPTIAPPRSRRIAGSRGARGVHHGDTACGRYDGEYRWLLSSGSPRYGTDGAFHGFVGGCLDITEHKEAEARLADLSRRLIVAQEEERRRIARELHDHLSQQLALLAIELQQLDMHPPDALSATLHDLWRRTTEIASDVHGISHRLHPSKLEALGVVITMRGHCRDISRHGVRVHFIDREVPPTCPRILLSACSAFSRRR